MKSSFFIIILLLMFRGTSIASDSICIDGLKYIVDIQKNTAKLMPNNYSGDLVIPKQILYKNEKYTVIEIAKRCFENCKYLSEIHLPNTISSLPLYCFYGCSNLKLVELPNSITYLGDHCFDGCIRLAQLELPLKLNSIGKYCFCYCALRNIKIPKLVNEVPESCFAFCIKLQAITTHPNIISLGNNCFLNCHSLKEILLPTGIKKIGDGCFADCWELNELTLPSSLETIGDNCFAHSSISEFICLSPSPPHSTIRTFDNCDLTSSILSLPNISGIRRKYKNAIGWANFKYVNNNSLHKNAEIKIIDSLKYLLDNKSKTAKVIPYKYGGRIVIPSMIKNKNIFYSVKYLSRNCFAESKVCSVVIPSSVLSLGDSCFYFCNIDSICMPSSIHFIGDGCFADCNRLLYVELSKSLTNLPANSFNGCSSIKKINIPINVKSIGDACF